MFFACFPLHAFCTFSWCTFFAWCGLCMHQHVLCRAAVHSTSAAVRSRLRVFILFTATSPLCHLCMSGRGAAPPCISLFAFATCCVSVCALQTPWLRTLGVRPNLSKRKDCIILSLCTFDFPEMRRFIYLYFMWVSCCNAVMTTCDMHAATGSSGEIFEARRSWVVRGLGRARCSGGAHGCHCAARWTLRRRGAAGRNFSL